MMLRQQNEFELQLMELHRVLETQRQLTRAQPPKSGSVGGGEGGPPRDRRDRDERRREGPR